MTRPAALIRHEAAVRHAGNTLANITRAFDHLATIAPDGYPAGGQGTRSNDIANPTLGAVISRNEGRGNSAGFYAVGISVIEEATAALLAVVDWAAEHQPPGPPATNERCAGTVNPECRNIRADGDRRHGGLCLECIAAACPRCHARPIDIGRHLADGRASCQACYRDDRKAVAS